MKTAELRTLLANIPGGVFTITAAQLGIADVTDLFKKYLSGDKMMLTAASGEPLKLTANGKLTLDSTALQTKAVFVADSTDTNVTGIEITCVLPGWTWTSANIEIKATSVAAYLESPQLTLRAGGNDPAQAEAAALVTGDIQVHSNSGKGAFPMTAPVPIPDPNNPQSLVFQGEPKVTLNDPRELVQFVTGANFSIIPDTIPLASLLELSQISLTVGPNLDAITGLLINLESSRGITIVKDKFEIESFTFTFVIPFPPTSTEVYGSISTTIDLNGIVLDIALLLSASKDLVIQGAVNQATPIPLKPFLKKFATVDAVPDNFALSDLMFGIALTSPHDWQFEIGLSNLWEISLTSDISITFEKLSVNATGAGASVSELLIYSAYSVAGTELYLSAHDVSGNWSFSGGTVGYQVINFIPLIQDLAQKFSLNSSTVPSSLTAFDLTNIQLTYTTGSAEQELSFTCSGQLAISDVTADATLSLDIKSSTGPNPFSIDFNGELSITAGSRQLKFATKVKQDGGQTLLLGTLNSENANLDFKDLLTAVGFSVSGADGLDISLKDLGVLYQAQPGANKGDTASTFIVTANSNYGSALFVARKETTAGAKPTSSTTYIFAVNPTFSGSLAQLPLIGAKIPPSLDVSLSSLQVLFASASLKADQVSSINDLLKQLEQNLPAGNWQIASGSLNYKAELSMMLSIGDTSTPFLLGIGANQLLGPPATRLLIAGEPAADDQGSAHWLSIQKALGPFFFNRIGFEYGGGDVEFLLDASLSFSALSISLIGLSIKSPLTSFQPQFGLHGLGLELNASALTISGAFLSVTPNGLEDSSWEYAGEISIQAEAFSIAGIGAYGKFQGTTSFFLFAMLDAPLGGPSFFFVTGLAGGFGYNRALTIPTLTDLPAFPLVAAAMSGETGNNPFKGKANDPGAAIQVMEKYLAASVGEDWVAVGVRFTSFELIQSFALVTIAFGTRFEVALLGLSAITVPTVDPSPIAFAELAIEVVFSPDEGLLAVAAQLTSASYVLSQSCHLTGGFAFYTWFKDNPATGAKAGEFVVSLGGYYPGYNVPARYPMPPILGANWTENNLTIKGGLYFALIPSAVMAGGYLEATWSSGNLKAWFNADANFLLSWKPFHYQANISLSLGASYTLHLGLITHTFTVHVGVALSLWGPTFAGVAQVDLDVASITIRFGGDNPSIQPIAWSDFKKSFLPPPSSSTQAGLMEVLPTPTQTNTYCLVQIGAGILKNLTQTSNPDHLDWVVDPERFQVVTSSVVPMTAASWVTGNGHDGNLATPLQGTFPNNFGVGPVGIANGDLNSEHVITMNQVVAGVINYAYVVNLADYLVSQVTRAVPAAPWSKALSLDLVSKPNISAVNSTPSTIAGVVTGYTIAPRIHPPDTTPAPISLAVLAQSPAAQQPEFSWSKTPIPATDPFDQSQAFPQFMNTLKNSNVTAVRTGVLALLSAQGVPVAKQVSIAELAASANQVLLAPPILSYLGEERAPA